MRRGLANLVNQEKDLAVCAEAESVQSALEAIKSYSPRLVLVDLSLQSESGLELIKDIKVRFPEVLILVISMHDETLYAERVLRAGGRGYIMKQEGPEKILQAVRQVLEGQIYLSGKMSVRILDTFAGGRSKASSPIARLTDRELEVLQLVGQGKDSPVLRATASER